MPDPKLVPAHPPSKADPLAAVVGGVLAALGALGVDLDLSTDQVLTAIGSLMTVAAAVRHWYQRRAARGS